MSQEEEPQKPSLRLRKTVDRPPESPPSAPAPSPVAPAIPKDEAPRPRLSEIIKSSGSDGPATPPEPPSPEPLSPPPVAMEPVVQQPVPKVVTPSAPTPIPAAATLPAPVAPQGGAPRVDIGLPKVEQPRELKFPPPTAKPQEEKSAPKPPSARTVGLFAVGGLVVLVAAIAYFFIMDPFGVFSAEAPPVSAQAQPVVTPPPAPVQTPTPAPVVTAPATVTAPTPTQPAVVEPEFKMPPPAPLDGGEEIAPGVVRLPRDAPPISFPGPRSHELPAPKPNPAYTAIVNNLNITGIRANDSGGFLMIGGIVHRPGDIIDQKSRLVFESIDGNQIAFKDPAGAVYTRRF